MDEFFSKTVVLLKKDDCERRDGKVFMPTTIEMAKIKKPNTGQYKTNVQFSPRMSEEVVGQKLRETFPTFDLNGRFSCAAVSQDSVTFQFHGDPRIWDGRKIKRTIRGNSVLYIVMDEDQMDTSGISGSDPEPTQDADQSLVQWLNDNVDFEVGMRPSESPLQGGNPFCATFRPYLHAQVTAGRAIFLMPNNDLETVQLTRVDGELFGSRFPAAREPGWATVKIESQDGIRLGETKIYYYPDGRHVVVMVRNPSIFEKVCLDMSHNLVGSSNSSDGRPQNSGALGFKQQVLLLCLLVYTAAKEGAKQFIELIFASSAGRMVFDAYRESSPLPEVIAKDHGNEETARYLEDVTKRFSKEKKTGGDQSQKIDWLELARGAKEAAKQPDHGTDEKDTSQLKSDLLKERGYSADVESSSSASSDHESSDSEGYIPTTSYKVGSTVRDEVQLGRNLLDDNNEDCKSQLGDKICKDTDVDDISSSFASLGLRNPDVTEINTIADVCCGPDWAHEGQECETRKATISQSEMSFCKNGQFNREQINPTVSHKVALPTLEGLARVKDSIIREEHRLQHLRSFYRYGISFFLGSGQESIQYHLITEYERWCYLFNSMKKGITYCKTSNKTAKGGQFLGHVSLKGPDVTMATSFGENFCGRKLNAFGCLQELHCRPSNRGSELLNVRRSFGDGFPEFLTALVETELPVRWKATEASTRHYSTNLEFWVLTCLFRPTRNILFVYVADSSDVLPHKTCFDDEEYELSTQFWQWHRYRNNSSDVQNRLQEMRKPSDMEAASVEKKVENAFEEPNAAKRMKKEPPKGKSVVVLRSTDVVRRNLTVFMPNTIEMAQLKKREKGLQFKTNVQISSKMTQLDIKEKLVETFPILEHKRFSCAAAVENRTRLDFHGEPRIWDGQFIKRTIKGNSALYILIEIKEAQNSGQCSTSSDQSKLKRSYDQLTSNEQSGQSTSNVTALKMGDLVISGSAQQGLEKQPNIFATPGGQTRSSTSDPVVVSGLAPKGFEKSNTQNPGERQVMGQKTHNLGFVLVPNSQPPLKQTLPMGKPASVRNDINSTASVHPSFGTAPCHAAKGLDVRQSGLQMVSSTLTPQMNSLNNSSVVCHQSWISNQTVQTVEATEASQQGLPIANMAQELNSWSTNPLPGFSAALNRGTENVTLQSNNGYENEQQQESDWLDLYMSEVGPNEEVGNLDDFDPCTLEQVLEKLKYDFPAVMSPDMTQTELQLEPQLMNSSTVTPQINVLNNSSIACQQSQKPVVADTFTAIANQTVRTVEAMETSQPVAVAEYNRNYPAEGQQEVVKLNSPAESRQFHGRKISSSQVTKTGASASAVTIDKQQHIPVTLSASDNESLSWSNPSDSGLEISDKSEASQEPGIVTVREETPNGNFIGETLFEYYDDPQGQEVLKQLVHDPNLQSDSDKRQKSQPPSHFTTAGSSQPSHVLSLLVYAAAKYGAQQFIEMIFKSSAGRVVFDAYKDNSTLPESVAKVHGNEETANFLEEITKR